MCVIKNRITWAVFIFTLVAAVSLRLLQLFAFVDSSGFYTDGGMLSYVILGILLASAAAIIPLTYSNRDLPKRYTQERSIPLAITEFALGAIAMVYSISDIMSMGSRGLKGGMLYVALILAFFGVGAGLVWIMHGVSCFIKKNLLRWLPMAGILPPLWMIILLFMSTVQFTGTGDISLNSEEAYFGTLARVAMTFFVFNSMKLIAGAQGKKAFKRVMAYGFISISFGIVSCLPNIISWITGINVAGPFDTIMAIVVLLICLFAIVFIVTVPKGENAYEEELVDVEEDEEDAEEPDEEYLEGSDVAKKPKKEKKKREGNAFQRGLMAFLESMEKLGDGINNGINKLFNRKKERTPFIAGTLDEEPTKRIDDSWRLDMYGLIDDDKGEFKPQIHELTEEQLQKQQRVRDEVARMIREDSEEEENNAPIPEWKQRRNAQKEKYERRYKKKK